MIKTNMAMTRTIILTSALLSLLLPIMSWSGLGVLDELAELPWPVTPILLVRVVDGVGAMVGGIVGEGNNRCSLQSF